MRPSCRHKQILGILLALVTGCGKPSFKTGEVEGVVTVGEKPLAEVSVLFTPKHVEGSTGPASAAITDASGHYKLSYTVPNNRDPASPAVGSGALLGEHTVTLSDIKMKNELLPPPGRVPVKYNDPSTTPLHFEVKDGPQTINIRLDPQ
jgi:hypothetical protein